MSELIMLVGVPTSGKTTYVKNLKSMKYWENAVILSTDNYIEKIAKEYNKTYNEVFADAIPDATRELELQLNIAKDKGEDIIFDQMNLSKKTRKKKLSKIPSHYRKTAVYFQLSLCEVLDRNKHREGKFIPESVLKQMYSQFEIPTYDEGFDCVECGSRTLDELTHYSP